MSEKSDVTEDRPETGKIKREPSGMFYAPLQVCLDKKGGSADFDEIMVGNFTRISFHRTLRVPEDGRDYPLPAGLGPFPIHRVEDFSKTVPAKWLQEGGFFIPLYQKEALFLQLEGPEWHPTIAKVCVGKINAVSGAPYHELLTGHKQDYVVIPNQRWLDGVLSGEGLVKQFVAMPLGQGYTIESQITDEENFGGFQIVVFEAVTGRFPERDPKEDSRIREAENRLRWGSSGLNTAPLPSFWDLEVSMGIAAGGSIKQQIYKDIYGIESWDANRKRSITIHLVNSIAYKAITGKEAPQSPITTNEYERAKIPWFSHYDETAPQVKPPSIFKRLLGVSEIDKKRGIVKPDEAILRLHAEHNIHKIRTPDKGEASSAYRTRAHESRAKESWEAAIRQISYVIDLAVDVCSDDFALRSCCNFKLGRFRDGAIDGSLGLEKNRECVEALSWRAYCRKELGDYEGLTEDANRLISNPETEIIGYELRAEAFLALGAYDEAYFDVIMIPPDSSSFMRAEEIAQVAWSRMDWVGDIGWKWT